MAVREKKRRSTSRSREDGSVVQSVVCILIGSTEDGNRRLRSGIGERERKMLFEIIGPDKKRKAFTESEECIPNDRVLLDMKDAGYTFLKDGKKWIPKKESKGK